MNLDWFFASLYAYMDESIIESALLCAFVWLVIRVARIDDASLRLRFYLLPLVIPSFLSPATHLLLPWIQNSALIFQFERRWVAAPTAALESSRELSPFIVCAFGALLLLSFTQWGVSSLRHRWWLNRHRLSDPSCSQRCERLLQALASRIKAPMPRLILTAQAQGPYAWSGAHCWIVVPRALITELDDEELEAVLAHELVHLQRRDTWHALLARIARDLMFFNPLAYWVYYSLELMREEACDELAVRVTDKPLALASSLLKAWRGQSQVRARPWAHAFLAARSNLERRVERLLTITSHAAPTRRNEIIFASMAILLLLVLSIV
jgi:Zn-dependent protease with chaperone function